MWKCPVRAESHQSVLQTAPLVMNKPTVATVYLFRYIMYYEVYINTCIYIYIYIHQASILSFSPGKNGQAASRLIRNVFDRLYLLVYKIYNPHELYIMMDIQELYNGNIFWV